MKALIVADVHSNREAFQAVISDAQARAGFDEIWSLGDLVGYGPDPVACIELLRSYPHKAVAGNHDLAAVGKLSLEAFNPYAAAANRWTATQLGKGEVEYLAGLPLKLEIDEFTLVHGSPRDPIWEYVISVPAAIATFTHMHTYWCLLGHSHIPFLCHPADGGAVFLQLPEDSPVKLGGGPIVINPGGTGQPRDGDPRAPYALYDSEAGTVAHYRVVYDIPTTQEEMRKHRLPDFLVERLAVGR